MTIEREERQHIAEDKKAHFGMFATTVTIFVMLAGLVWNQATWQAQMTKDITIMKDNIIDIRESVEENGNLIKLNTIKISDLESMIQDTISREEMLHWMMQLEKDNPDISVPVPPLKGSK